MKKIIPVLLIALSISVFTYAQEDTGDSTRLLSEVVIRAFEQHRKQNSSTASVRVIDLSNSDRNNKTSLVNSFNSIAGVRMEERSPGSYRINIRGSSLRSPFGVRNVKVYWNDLPVTDPSGNTYFNQFAWNNFSSIEIFKGPASSLYGSGTGGLILLNNLDRWQPGVSAEYVTGSYNLQNVFASARFGQDDSRNQVTFAHNQTDGYRTQTALRRDNVTWESQLKLSEKQQLTASVLFTDMQYQTPGALTLAEYNADPKAARPAGGGFPSAVGAHATIYQKNILAGFSNQYAITQAFHNTTSLYGAFSQIKNPTIRNYERRNEPQFGGRSVFVYDKKKPGLEWQWVGGAEFQQGYFNTQVSNNRNGNPDTIQTNDDVRNTNLSVFTQLDVTVKDQWFFTGGLSLNKSEVDITRLNKYPVTKQSRTYQDELAPRLSVMRKFDTGFSLLATVSRGFSPPTVAEVLPSTGVISTNLEAEYGWNYEMTARALFFKKRLQVEATGFYFKLNSALVQRRDISGGDYFINAGNVKQKGLELHADYTYLPSNRKFLSYILLQGAYTYNHFRYGSFAKGTDDFTGNEVPSVPSDIFSTLADVQLKNGIYLNTTYYAASKIYLNDANTASTGAYHLLGARVGFKKIFHHQYKLNFYAGADNLLDEKYSLGTDINAAGGRYYNAAPRRNYYAGIALQWLKRKS
jgi:iron complex outermembrane recepter protein